MAISPSQLTVSESDTLHPDEQKTAALHIKQERAQRKRTLQKFTIDTDSDSTDAFIGNAVPSFNAPESESEPEPSFEQQNTERITQQTQEAPVTIPEQEKTDALEQKRNQRQERREVEQRAQHVVQDRLGQTRIAKQLNKVRRERKAAYLHIQRKKSLGKIEQIKKIRHMVRVAKVGTAATLYGIIIAIIIMHVEWALSIFYPYPFDKWDKILTIIIDIVLLFVVLVIVTIVYFTIQVTSASGVIELLELSDIL